MKKSLKEKLLSWFLTFSIVMQSAGIVPLVAHADVTVDVTDFTGSTTHYTIATSTDNIAIAYTTPEGFPTTTPTLDTIADIFSIISDALVSAKASTSCTGSGSATANAATTATVSLNGESVVASATASASVNCTPNTEPPTHPSPVTIVAQKIVCDTESQLPNWGNGGPDITATTATDFLATHQGCRLVPNWQFQWGFGAIHSPIDIGIVEGGVHDLTGDFVGEADGSSGAGTNTGTAYNEWKTFGPTDANGQASIEISNLYKAGSIWVREVLKNGYIPFTFDAAHPTNANDVSAEMYCANDALNYDNYDYIGNPTLGETYYCIAFNVEKKTTPPPPPVCSIDLYSDASNTIGTSGTQYATSTYDQNPRWTAMIPGATWIWKTFFVEHPTQDEYVTFSKSFSLPSSALGGMLTVAADNSYAASVNGNVVGVDNTEFNYFESGKDVFNVLSQLQTGTNTLSVTVKNWAGSGNPESNPAGLLYKLHIELAGEGCEPTPPPVVNTKPIITVTGTNPINISLGGLYTELGATVLDAEDGDITNKLIIAGTVNTNVLGAYTITYNATDTQNLAADTKTRTVNVVTQCSDGVDNDNDGVVDLADDGCDNPTDNDENSRPVITVATPNPLVLTVSAIFIDTPTALDLEDGTITPNIITTGTVNTAIVGSYTLTYNVSDSNGLSAITKTRVVNVEPVVCVQNCGDDNQQPVITVVGANPLTISIGGIFVDPSATVADPEDGNITSKLVVGGAMVNTAMVGNYTITYNATDTQNLSAVEKTRLVKVTSSCSDGNDNDGDGLIDFPLDAGCDDANDDSENSKPIISLLGSVIMSIVVGNTYAEPSATVLDAEDGDITSKLIIAGTVNTNVLGAYTITYNATDTQNLAADTKTRTVNIISGDGGGGGGTPPACSDGSDNDGDGFADFPRDPGCDSSLDNDERDTGPTLTLLGANPITLTVGTTFTDPGATAQDLEEGDITSRIVVAGSVDGGTVGTYTLTYSVSDSQGHIATPVTRTVNVVTGGGGGGGGSIALNITNELLTITGTSTVLITWNTNQPATSRVVYGLTSIPTLGIVPLYSYSLSTATNTALTTTHSMTIDGIPSGVATYFRPVSTDGVRIATGIELARTPASILPGACFYLREYMRLGGNNNPEEVTKLQTFLRDFEGFTALPVTGIFDVATDVSVRAFQDKYASEVLTPWGLAGSTGYVYYTTQKKINEIFCKRSFPLSDDQLAELALFRNLVARINTQTTEAPELPLVGINTVVGSVAGASTERGPRDGGNSVGVPVSDLLAAAPGAVNGILDENTEELGENVELDINGDVAGTSTTRNLAAVVNSVSDTLHITNGTLYFLMLFIILTLIFSTIYIRSRNEELVEEEIE